MRSYRWLVWGMSCALLLLGVPSARAETPREPSFMHGVGQVVAGVVLELPKTVLEATMTEPPVVGTVVGLFAGTARALQVTVGGLVEMASTFDPWGSKKQRAH